MPALSQDVTTVDKAIEKLRQICLASRTYAVDLGVGGEFAVRGTDGRLMGLFKLTFAEIFGLADKIPPDQIASDLKETRQCMREGLDRMVAKLAGPRDGPAIVLMDSLLAPYRSEMVDVGQTNGDDLTVALRLLATSNNGSSRPVPIIKETTGLKWDREAEVLNLKPNLLVIHFSAFDAL